MTKTTNETGADETAEAADKQSKLKGAIKKIDLKKLGVRAGIAAAAIAVTIGAIVLVNHGNTTEDE